MRRGNLILLMAGTAVMMAVAIAVLVTGGLNLTQAAPDLRALPALAARLGDVASVEVEHTGFDLTFVREGAEWLVTQKSDYPADGAKIRRIVLELADMTLVEPKTAKPDLYPRLQVEDPGKGKSTLVTIKDKSGTDIGQLLVGKRAYDRLGEGSDGIYVRKPGDPQSWLARGSVDFSGSTPDWLVRRIVDIADSRVARVSLTQPDGSTLILSRTKPEAKFVLENAPKDAKYKSDTTLSEPAMALETLDLEDVAAATKLSVPDKGTTLASYTTFDGLTLEAKLFQHNNRDWIALAASGSGKSAGEATRINRRVSRWVYAIPAYKAKMLQTKLADLLEPAKGS
jgi:hypothetical protein